MIYPEMHPEELRELCELAGHPLTNDEAQELLQELTVYRAWEEYFLGKTSRPLQRHPQTPAAPSNRTD